VFQKKNLKFFTYFALSFNENIESKYAGCLYFTANALARKVEKIAIETWKKVDLSPSHAYLLMLTLDEPGIQAGRLAGSYSSHPVPLHVYWRNWKKKTGDPCIGREADQRLSYAESKRNEAID
jgi:hypothetical protein